MKEIQLQLTIDDLNTIIESLSKQPFKDVYKLIEKIHIQAKDQMIEQKKNKIE